MATQPEPVSRHRRRYLRFNLRGLIVLVLVIGAGMGWMVRQAHIQRDAVAAIRKAGGHAYYDIDPGNKLFSWYEPSAWRKLIGEHIGIDFVSHIVYISVRVAPESSYADCRQALDAMKEFSQLEILNLSGGALIDDDLAGVEGLRHLKLLLLQNRGVSSAGLAHVRNLTSLQELYITNTDIGDDGVSHFLGLRNLKHLTLWGTSVTGAGMERLSELVSLQSLELGYTRVSDAGLRHLEALSSLKNLSLAGTKVTDRGVSSLKGLTNLTTLVLHGSQVTDAGERKLIKALAKVVIE